MTTNKIAKLFEGWEEAMIWSCLQGCMGRLFSNDEENPTAAMADVGDFCFFAGIPDEALLDYLEGAKLLVPQTESWEQLIEVRFGDRVKKITRYAIKKESDVFDREKLAAFVAALDGAYTLHSFDNEVFALARKEEWSFDLCSQYTDFKDFQTKNALGVALLRNGELAAGASAYVTYRQGIEIEIDTKPEYRNNGLATVCGAKLILECLDRGLYPSWDAHDMRSVALAEKLGYHLDAPYTAYELDEDLAQ